MKTASTMKRLALTCLVLCLLTGSALANSWGLTGKLLNAVSGKKIWDNYTSLSNQAGPFAVMQSRYHYALFFADSQDELHVYTTAVYQPESKRKDVRLSLDGDVLTLRYGDQERYSFCRIAGSDEYELSEAEIGSFRVKGIPGEFGFAYNYQAEDGNGTVVLPEKITLANFNIDLFPHSTDRIRHLNYMHARLRGGLLCLGAQDPIGEGYSPDRPGTLLKLGKKGTVAVYSSPYGKSAWQAGKGKAAAGLKDDIWLLAAFVNADGETYACIRYDVSERTQRIGYARCRDLGMEEPAPQDEKDPGYPFVRIDVEATAETYLTDDPDVSQFHQFTVPEGTQFTCLGLYNDSYAYVSAEVKNGKFTDGGSIVWGFVPIRDLKPLDREVRQDIMEQLSGSWELEAGGSLADDVLRFRADGTFTAGSSSAEESEGILSGTWTVTEYSSFMNLYWNNPPYEITLRYDNGRSIVRGLTVADKRFSLTDREGGGGYIRTDENTPYDSGDGDGNG